MHIMFHQCLMLQTFNSHILMSMESSTVFIYFQSLCIFICCTTFFVNLESFWIAIFVWPLLKNYHYFVKYSFNTSEYLLPQASYIIIAYLTSIWWRIKIKTNALTCTINSEPFSCTYIFRLLTISGNQSCSCWVPILQIASLFKFLLYGSPKFLLLRFMDCFTQLFLFVLVLVYMYVNILICIFFLKGGWKTDKLLNYIEPEYVMNIEHKLLLLKNNVCLLIHVIICIYLIWTLLSPFDFFYNTKLW